jgi:DNA-binding NtrC family response regulator
MDISLAGEMDGITCVKEFQKQLPIPVIYNSGNSDVWNKQRAEETIYIDFLVKPTSRADLKIALKKL